MAPQEKALITAANTENVAGISAALAAGANIHANGDAAMLCAAAGGRVGAIGRLLAANADIHVNLEAPLRWAAIGHHDTTVRLLLAAGADPVVALKNTHKNDRGNVVTILDACADVVTSEHRAALLAISRQDEFVQLRAIAESPEKHRAIHR